MNPITLFLTVIFGAIGVALGAFGHLYFGIAFVVAAVLISAALKMANTWEKFVILRAGKLHGVKGAGLFLILNARLPTTYCAVKSPARSPIGAFR